MNHDLRMVSESRLEVPGGFRTQRERRRLCLLVSALLVGSFRQGFLPTLTFSAPSKTRAEKKSTPRHITPFMQLSQNGPVNGVAFSADGKSVTMGGGKGLGSWDIATGKSRWTVALKESDLNALATSPDGRLLACGEGRAIKLRKSASGEIEKSLVGHFGDVRSVAFSPEGSLLASGSEDRSVMLWEVQTGQLRWRFGGFEEAVESVAFSMDGRTLMTGYGGGFTATPGRPLEVYGLVKLWSIQSRSVRRTLEGANVVSFSPEGNSAATGDALGQVRLWDTRAWCCQRVLKGQGHWVSSLSFSPNGKMLAAGYCNDGIGESRLWNTRTGGLIGILCDEGIQCVAFSGDSKTVAGGGIDGTLRLWRAE
ncbi:MAG: WD40 repeat domain-containing protein [Armatimonadetes bacterium]|nr:WD40 repeat domain-containing protein [Armatimonadota bacterium]